MIKAWQDARLKDRSVASPDQLITAPISDFYDPTRAEELRKVERRTYEAYKRLVSAAVEDRSLGLGHIRGELAPGEKYLKIISAFRSPEYQEKLRRQSPNSGTAGLAVNSPHFTGRAVILTWAGTRWIRRIQTALCKYRHAFTSGWCATPIVSVSSYCYEPWHWEYVR